MMHPVGPHDSQTYWLRRTLVAVVAVALVVGVVWWALGRGSGPGTTPVAGSTSQTTTPQLTGVLATDKESAVGDPLTAGTTGGEAAAGSTGGLATAPMGPGSDGATPATVPSTGAASTGAGSAGSGSSAPGTTPALPTVATAVAGTSVVKTTSPAPVTVTVTKHVPATGTATKAAAPKTTPPPKPSYDSAGRLICPAASIGLTGVVWGTIAGQQPRLGMNVTNIGKQACQQDVSGAAQIYTVVTSAGDRVWSTADCFPGEGHDVRALAVGQKASYVVLWSGTTSEPGCGGSRVKVKAGTYELVVQLGSLKSKPLPFTMR
ncbi:MAG: hypothetical protein ABI382_02430 [Nakamurella sp.]